MTLPLFVLCEFNNQNNKLSLPETLITLIRLAAVAEGVTGSRM